MIKQKIQNKEKKMRILFNDSVDEDVKTWILPIFADNKFGTDAEELDKKSNGLIRKAVDSSTFEGKFKEKLELRTVSGTGLDNIILIGIGSKSELDSNKAEEVGSLIEKTLNELRIEDAAVFLNGVRDFGDNIADGAYLYSHRFDKYRTKQSDKDKPSLDELSFVCKNSKDVEEKFDILKKIAGGVFFARDLTAEPPNVLYPESYAKRVKEMFKGTKAKVEILSEKKMMKLGMGSLLGVGQGSAKDSQLVVVNYQGNPDKSEKPVALVGKGITFDTGGISLKPPAGMDMMKWDMGGSAAVIGAMKAIVDRGAKANVVCVLALAENMPSSNAQRPGDIVTSMSGQTIEVLNTDAEGRLVLADAMTYVQKFHDPKIIIDAATLTGAILVALGHEYGGLFSNNNVLANQLVKSGEAVKDRLWQMPMCTAWDKQVDSEIADMKNIGGKYAGSATAAAFLERFVENDTPWAHLDIAGMAWSDTEKPVSRKGATGYGVRLLNKFIEDNFEG